MEFNMDKLKLCADGASWCVIISTIAGWLPPIAALASLIWTGIQVYSWWKSRKVK